MSEVTRDKGRIMKSKTIVLLCTAATLLFSVERSSAVDDMTAVAADAIVGRPLCLAATIVGSAIFVVTLPVAATSHSIHSTADILVCTPAWATFGRPLGDFSYGTSDKPTARHQKHNHRHAKRVEKPKG
jgi:hypothetical protein